MRVFKYELQKYFKNKFLLFVFAAFLILCAMIFYSDCSSQLVNPEEYTKMHQKIDLLSLEEASLYIKGEQEKYTFYDQYAISSDKKDIIDQYQQLKGEQWVTRRLNEIKKMKSYDFHSQQELLTRINNEINNNLNYSSYRLEMKKQAQLNQEISIFKDDKNEKMSQKIVNAYEKIEPNVLLSLAPTLGLEKWLSFSLPAILSVFLVVYLIGMMVFQERSSEFTLFTETMRKGKQTQYFSKLCALLLISSVWLIIAYSVCGLITYFLYSFPSFDVVIQSVPLLMKSIINGNILLLIVLFLLFHVIMNSIIGSIAYLISRKINSYPMFLFIIASLFGLSYLMYANISELSSLAILKYFNLYSFMQPIQYLGNYICVNVLQVPFSIHQMLVIGSIITIIFVLLFSNQRIARVKRNRSIMFIKKVKKPRSLLYYECNKVWFKNYGIILFIVLLLLQGLLLINTKSNHTIEDVYYNHYVDTIGNTVSEASAMKLQEQARLYEQLQQKPTNRLTYQELDKMSRYSAFIKYQNNYIRIKETKGAMLLKENEYALLFENNTMNRSVYVLIVIGLTLMVSASFYRENESGVDKIQKISLKGNTKLWNHKIVALLSFAIPLSVLLYTMIVIRNQQFYPHLQYHFNIENLSHFLQYRFSGSIYFYLLISVLFKVIAVGLFCFIISYLAKQIHNRYALLLIIATICLVGFLLERLTNSILYNPLYNMMHISLLSNIYQAIVVLVGLAILGIFCFWKGRKI